MKELANLVLDLRRFRCFKKLANQRQACDYMFVAINQRQKEDAGIDLYAVNAQVIKVKKQQDKTELLIT